MSKNPNAVALGKLGREAMTEKQRLASIANGKKGGRPKGSKNKPKEKKDEK